MDPTAETCPRGILSNRLADRADDPAWPGEHLRPDRGVHSSAPGVSEADYAAYRARWAGGAMAACPDDVPWQRVINSQGKISERPGAEHQRELLEQEGVGFDARDKVDLSALRGAARPPIGCAPTGWWRRMRRRKVQRRRRCLRE